MDAILRDELALSERIISEGNELVPRLRIFTRTEGELHLFARLPDNIERRLLVMRLLATFMHAKQAHAYVWASELHEPDAHVAFALGADGALRAISCRSAASRSPFSRPSGSSPTMLARKCATSCLAARLRFPPGIWRSWTRPFEAPFSRFARSDPPCSLRTAPRI